MLSKCLLASPPDLAATVKVKRQLIERRSSTASAFENYFLAAQALRNRIKADFDAVFKQRRSPSIGLEENAQQDPSASSVTEDGPVDCLIHPAAISSAPRLGSKRIDENSLQEYVQDVLNVPSSLAGIPALSVPWGADDAGWPLAVQLAAPWGQERTLFQLTKMLTS